MNIQKLSKISRLLIVLMFCLLQSSCIIGTVAGAAVKTTVAVIKVPFKVGAKVVDAVIPDKKSDEKDDQ